MVNAQRLIFYCYSFVSDMDPLSPITHIHSLQTRKVAFGAVITIFTVSFKSPNNTPFTEGI